MHSHFITKLLGLEDVEITHVEDQITHFEIHIQTPVKVQKCPLLSEGNFLYSFLSLIGWTVCQHITPPCSCGNKQDFGRKTGECKSGFVILL